ncbi:hypothetical protein PV08_04434 [Exophiala spinifera]|uniref:Zn(2)-C6 fungal-type domain-containing protein n=1 Tax=Exophiala spinifera TaxID=91928 RepID=A0A0D2BE37_9EURO|nr:uncharacterized protein PV08_04434 [Exophiala spinifera]KIW17243.1 hypothetical protein PV08_04434 [Exophiala spinifera]
MQRSGEKRISCKRCQTRKIRCSRTTPCRSCATAGVKCEFRSDDWKRVPVSQEYVTALEARVATLESFLSSIKSSTGEQRDEIIRGIDVDDHLPTGVDRTPSIVDVETFTPPGYWGATAEGSPVFHRAGSAYGTGLIQPYPSSQPVSDAWLHSSISSIPRLVIDECVDLFFQWQRPFCRMLDRDSIPSRTSALSEPISGLVHAVCALGALMSHDQNIKHLAPLFIAAAENAVADSFDTLDVTTAQTFLLCAVFESGRGNASKGWMYSGVALRVAEALGIHEDHLQPVSTGPSGTLPVDFESRRRMSLTLAISDKMLSLFFGHTPMMNLAEYDTDPKQIQPVVVPAASPDDAIAYQISPQPAASQIASYSSDDDSTGFYSLLLQKQAQLATIAGDFQNHTYLSRRRRPSRRSEVANGAVHNKLNARLLGWYNSLPSELRWSRWTSNNEPLDPGVATTHVLYHIVRLVLNRPLLAVHHHSPHLQLAAARQASDICVDSVETIVGILRRYRAQHTLMNAPLVFVHGVITAADTTLLIDSTKSQNHDTDLKDKDSVLPFLDVLLSELSYSWTVAGHARDGLRNRLQQMHTATLQRDDYKSFSSPSTSTEYSCEFSDLQSTDLSTSDFSHGAVLPQDPPWPGVKPQLDLEILGATELEFDLSNVFQYGGGVSDMYPF